MKTDKPDKTVGQVVDRFLDSIGKSVHLELWDGTARNGRCTGFTTAEMMVNGVTIHWPTHLELNGDPADHVPLASVRVAEVR